MSNVKIKIKTDNELLRELYKDKLNYPSDAGFDLYCPERIVCPATEKTIINLEVRLEVVEFAEQKSCWVGVSYFLMPRGSFSKSTLLLCNSFGLIDVHFRGELKAVVFNYAHWDYVIDKGDRLFQLTFPKLNHIADYSVVDELSSTDRGEAGFGSTGK